MKKGQRSLAEQQFCKSIPFLKERSGSTPKNYGKYYLGQNNCRLRVRFPSVAYSLFFPFIIPNFYMQSWRKPVIMFFTQVYQPDGFYFEFIGFISSRFFEKSQVYLYHTTDNEDCNVPAVRKCRVYKCLFLLPGLNKIFLLHPYNYAFRCRIFII